MAVIGFLKKLPNTILSITKDPKYPLLGPNVGLLKICGIWHPVKDLKTILSMAFLYITLGFFFTQYIKCCVNINIDALRAILQYAPFHISVFKVVMFLKDHGKWSELIEYVTTVELEQLSKQDSEIVRIICGSIKYSHQLTLFYWTMGIITNANIFSDLYRKANDNVNVSDEYIRVFDGFTPWSRDPPGYYYIFVTQSFFANVLIVYLVAWDQLVVALMIFYRAQLKICSIYCKRAIKTENIDESHENIEACHRFHTELVKHQEMMNSLTSPAMFLYLIVISVNLGLCIIEIVELKDNLSGLVSNCTYVVACLVQLLLFYWHSNEVTEQSLLVSYSTFESDWVESDRNVRNKIIILAHSTNKRLVFQAGPFNEMSLATFVSILRGSYSFYTLLNETN